MSRALAIQIDHLADVPLDLPGVFLRLERRHWVDGTSCLDIRKYAVQPNTGRTAPWWQPQYVQIPWWLVGRIVEALTKVAGKAAWKLIAQPSYSNT